MRLGQLMYRDSPLSAAGPADVGLALGALYRGSLLERVAHINPKNRPLRRTNPLHFSASNQRGILRAENICLIRL